MAATAINDGSVTRFLQLTLWGALGLVIYVSYTNIGQFFNYWPFGYNPVWGTQGFIILVLTTAVVSYLIVWLALRSAFKKGYRHGFQDGRRAISGGSK